MKHLNRLLLGKVSVRQLAMSHIVTLVFLFLGLAFSVALSLAAMFYEPLFWRGVPLGIVVILGSAVNLSAAKDISVTHHKQSG